MKLGEIMAELAAKGSETYKRIMLKHGAREPFFGVKIGDLKPMHKKLRGQQALALELYATGNGDAQYLAGMIVDGRLLTAAQLQTWVDTAGWGMIAGTIVPWVASENADGCRLALKWIDAKNPDVARAGWNTLGALAATKPDDELPLERYDKLLDRVVRDMPKAHDDVRYAMNHFVITCGTYLKPLATKSVATARALGRVEIDMGDTACKVPDAESYMLKARGGAAIAPKRKTVRC